MTNETSHRKGATWKRFLAGFAIAAATTVAGAGMADAAGVKPKPPTGGTISTVATTTGGSTSTGGTTGATVSVVTAASGIRW